MKYLKKFNEERTIGYRYSDPTEMYILKFEAEPNSVDVFKDILIDLKVDSDDISYIDDTETYVVKFRVFSEKDVDDIINQLIKSSVRKSVDIDPDTIRVEARDY